MLKFLIGLLIGLGLSAAYSQVFPIQDQPFLIAGGVGPDGQNHHLMVNPDGSVNCKTTIMVQP